jgi:phage repressor protein C with HTH and peptisase S24 domain
VSETWAYNELAGGAEQVTIRPRGNSMTPLIRDRQQVTIRRLGWGEPLAVGDIVLARVRGHVYLHKISAVAGNKVQISNNHGHVNGWTSRSKVVGKVSQ